MYHTSNIQNNIHDYQKLKNFNNIFWFEKAFLMYDMCVVNFSMLLDTHVIKTKNYFEKYVLSVCIYTNTQHRTYKKYQIIRIIMILYA